MSLELVNQKKIKADNYISVLMIIYFSIFASFFHLEAILAVAVYPLVSLIAYKSLFILKYFNKKNSEERNPVKFFFGIVSIIFSILFLWYILVQTAVTVNILMILCSFPMIIVGFAGIIKASVIDIYSKKHRIMSTIIGFITIIISLLIFVNTFNELLFSIIALSLTLLLNILSRAALYLSEFGLSIVHIKNFKIFFYIISDYIIYINRDGNLVLSKI
ncbi:MAG: hypothetical protein ACFFAA_00705 [Promethearchaeota archaeon]